MLDEVGVLVEHPVEHPVEHLRVRHIALNMVLHYTEVVT